MKFQTLTSALICAALASACSDDSSDPMGGDGGTVGADGGTQSQNDAGTTSSGGSGLVIYSDQIGLYATDGAEPTELGTGPDYQVLTRLRLSPDGANLMHTVGRDLRITSTTDGSFTVAAKAGYYPFTWIDANTVLAGEAGAGLGAIGNTVTIKLDGTESMAVDVAGKEYCTAGPQPLSPDKSKVIMRCGFGNNGELVLGEMGGTVTGHGSTAITQSGTPPIWTPNDYVVHINGGNIEVFDPDDLDTAMALGISAGTILPAGPDAVLAISTEVGAGGRNINTFKKVAIPSGDVTDMAWLAEPNPPFEKVVFSADGNKVLYADGNGIFSASVDGSGKEMYKEMGTGALSPALQSITW